MSVDFTAIFSHPFNDSDILTVPERLNADQESLGNVVAHYHNFVKQTGHYPSIKDDIVWHWEEGLVDGLYEWNGNSPEAIWNSNNPIELVGSPFLRIHFGRETCYLFAPLSWSIFLKDTQFQLETRRVCFAITQAFAGGKAIYVRDSDWRVRVAIDRVYENDGLQQIEDWLKKNIGEPSPTIAYMQELMKHQDLEDCYFIDYFSDLDDRQ